MKPLVEILILKFIINFVSFFFCKKSMIQGLRMSYLYIHPSGEGGNLKLSLRAPLVADVAASGGCIFCCWQIAPYIQCNANKGWKDE